MLNSANLVRSALTEGRHSALTIESLDAQSFARKRLLVVDDSVTTRTLLKSILETAGYDVVSANDGQEAFDMLSEYEFDLIVSDVDMPRMSGFDLTRSIRNSGQWSSLPVVLVTARGSDDDKMRGIDVGADGYIVKTGFDQKNLLETIAQLL